MQQIYYTHYRILHTFQNITYNFFKSLKIPNKTKTTKKIRRTRFFA